MSESTTVISDRTVDDATVSFYASASVSWLWALCAVASFKLAFSGSSISLPAIAVFVLAMTQLTRAQTARIAFYSGLVCGTSIAARELTFFQSVFGPAAVGLWMVFGIWLAMFTLVSRLSRARWPTMGPWLLPVLWMGFEYFRSELYYLRFSWMTPGLALTESRYEFLLSVGQYGVSLFLVLIAVAAESVRGRRYIVPAIIAVWLLICLVATSVNRPSDHQEVPLAVGIQWEHPDEATVLKSLDSALARFPDVELLMLSEYTFDGPIPDAVMAWCQHHRRYLVAGGKTLLPDDEFYNTAFVVGPAGSIVFQQVKVVPIQFFNDGLPAPNLELWDSPWGKIGFAVCYDMSYSRVIDQLVAEGASAIINPTMDPVDWGAYEHEVHSRIPVCRAREYQIPVLRVASSGISVLTGGDGKTIQKGSFPGQGEMLSMRLHVNSNAARPLDRFLAPLSVVLTMGILILLLAGR